MPTWLENLFIAVGGGSVVLIGLLTIFKRLFIKLFESAIGSSFEKNLEKYRNKLTRSTKAYEILLEKEFNYYSILDPYLAILVPLIQDLVYYVDYSVEMEIHCRQKRYKEKFLAYLELIPKVKNDVILYQPYVPIQITGKISHLLAIMQKEIPFWTNVGEIIFQEDSLGIDLSYAKNTCDEVLLNIASVEMAIKTRLEKLSEL